MTARRTCEQCGSLMPPFVPRHTLNGRKVCEGCKTWHNKTALTKVAQLENPIHDRTGHADDHWFHGSHHEFPKFEENSGISDDEGHYGASHWNTLLGHHFTSDHQVAADFAEGIHSSAANINDEAEAGRVIHAKLHLKNPKVYKSEHDMDQEVHEFEHARGNTIDSHLPPPEASSDDDEWDDHYSDMGKARHYGNDSKEPWSKHEPDPAFAYGFHPKATGWLNTHPDKDGIAARFKQRLKDAGHDGIVYGNEYEESNFGKSATSAIAFHPHQIEIHHDHTVNQNCKRPEDIGREPGEGQIALPGMENLDRKRPYHPRPQRWMGPKTWHDPKMWRESKMTPHGIDWGRLTAPLPQECWDRYHGRHTASSSEDMIDLYHHTTPAKAESIMRDGFKSSRTNTWFTDNPASRDMKHWGTAQIHVRMPKSRAFYMGGPSDNEGHYVVNDHEIDPIANIVGMRHIGKTATVYPGHETALHEMGRQTVYPVSTPRGVTNLCQHHLNVHQSISEGSNDLAGHLGIPQAPSEPLGAPQTGKCADCNKNTSYQLKLQRPEGYDRQQQRDSQQPRTRQTGPYVPSKTKPLIVLRQSQNKRSSVSGSFDNGSVRPLREQTTDSVVIMGSNRRAPGQRLDHLRGSTFPQVSGPVSHDTSGLSDYYGVKLANEQGELFHVEPTGPQHSPKAEWHQRMIDKHAPKPETEEDEGESEGRECRACGERHGDDETTDRHESSWTDWDTVYPRLNDTVHRVLKPLDLPAHVHDAVHDESRPMHERAGALLNHINGEHGNAIGMHWSDQRDGRDGADKFAGHGSPEGTTQVMLHAKLPERHHIETDPDELERNEVISYGGHDEAEVPISHGAPVHVSGISWRPGGFGQQWRKHNLKEPMTMTAKKLPTLRMVAHDATENQEIRHCPMCGGGKIIGRQDGSVECEYCHSYFTVQIQPQFPNFPQTIDGMPQQIPGMPGQVETPPGAMVPGQEMPPGEDPAAEEGGNPFAEGDADAEEAPAEEGGDEPPPFAKKSFRTVTGALLDEDAYARHMAIRLASDRDAMIALVRQEQGAR